MKKFEGALGFACAFLIILIVPYAYWIEVIRFSRPREPNVAEGFVHRIENKIVFYVNDYEFFWLSVLFYGFVMGLLITFIWALFFARKK